MNNKLIDLFRKYDSNYVIKESIIQINYMGINIYYEYKDKKIIYLDKSYFGKIPHVMMDGSLCIVGNQVVQLKELNEEEMLKNCIEIYIPWLVSLPENLKVLEFLSELQYYCKNLLEYKKVNPLRKIDLTIAKGICINDVNGLWETISSLPKNKIFRLYTSKYNRASVYILKTQNEIKVNYDRYTKACQRVSGINYDTIRKKVVFIGVGSVNSYIIKNLLSKELNKIVLIDDGMFTVDNVFRFAFPYKNKYKIDAVKEFCKILNKDILIQGYKIKIKSESSSRFISDCDEIYVSVDNPNAWIDIKIYLEKNCNKNQKIIFVGVDAFGGFGKFVHVNIKNLAEGFRNFIFYDNGSGRKSMIGNGCGKSIAVYDEENLNKLAKEAIKKYISGEVIEVSFNED
jgi:tRNA A37 threonylcarbamoyladenosine dehydratase